MTEVWRFGGVWQRYTYNADNRLVKATSGVGAFQAEYYYDPFGRRLWKEVNGVKTYFFYSDEGLVAEYGPGMNRTRIGLVFTNYKQRTRTTRIGMDKSVPINWQNFMFALLVFLRSPNSSHFHP